MRREQIEASVRNKSEVIQAIENGLLSLARGEIQNIPTTVIKPYGDANPAVLVIKGAQSALHTVIKNASYHPDNQAKKIASIQGNMMVMDTETGVTQGVLLDDGILTNERTAAVGAVAAKYLSRPDSTKVVVVGAGMQARLQVEYLKHVRDVREVAVAGRSPENVQRYIREMTERMADVRFYAAEDLAASCRKADIIVTTTPSTKPIIQVGWVSPGTHINAMGSDKAGKQELDPAILTHPDTIYIPDSREQCARMGELQHVKPDHEHAPYTNPELSEAIVIAQTIRCKIKSQIIRIFDSTGIGAADYAIAMHVMRTA